MTYVTKTKAVLWTKYITADSRFAIYNAGPRTGSAVDYPVFKQAINTDDRTVFLARKTGSCLWKSDKCPCY